jgi:hypothetical protein
MEEIEGYSILYLRTDVEAHVGAVGVVVDVVVSDAVTGKSMIR